MAQWCFAGRVVRSRTVDGSLGAAAYLARAGKPVGAVRGYFALGRLFARQPGESVRTFARTRLVAVSGHTETGRIKNEGGFTSSISDKLIEAVTMVPASKPGVVALSFLEPVSSTERRPEAKSKS